MYTHTHTQRMETEDWVSKLKEFCEKEKVPTPVYSFLEPTGQQSRFVATTRIDYGMCKGITFCGEQASTKKQAKQMVARLVLNNIATNKKTDDHAKHLMEKEFFIIHQSKKEKEEEEPLRIRILIDVDNFPTFIKHISGKVLSSDCTTTYLFTTKPIRDPPTGSIVIDCSTSSHNKVVSPTGQTSHVYMSVYLGRLLSKNEKCRYIIVAGDKFANELIRVIKDDSFTWTPQEAVHCKVASELFFLLKK